MKKALITGITGQDGSYLFETLIQEMVEKDLELYSSVKAGIDRKK